MLATDTFILLLLTQLYQSDRFLSSGFPFERRLETRRPHTAANDSRKNATMLQSPAKPIAQQIQRGNPMAEKEQKNQANPISVNDSAAICGYANFCRVTGSPEELIIDFGLNSQPMGSNDKPVDITQRIVLNFYTAKRLLHALHVSVQRHEEVFGKIETDIQKRVVPQAAQTAKATVGKN